MKRIVSVMMKYNLTLTLLVALFLTLWYGQAQASLEGERRVLKSQFPQNALSFLEDNLDHPRRMRYYKMQEGRSITYRASFKKDRLRYGMDFDPQGELTAVGFLVKEVDIPGDSWDGITTHLGHRFEKFRIREIRQQYPVPNREDEEKVLVKAFQNLIVPEMNYVLILTGKTREGYKHFNALFDGSGTLIALKYALPVGHDHILY